MGTATHLMIQSSKATPDCGVRGSLPADSQCPLRASKLSPQEPNSLSATVPALRSSPLIVSHGILVMRRVLRGSRAGPLYFGFFAAIGGVDVSEDDGFMGDLRSVS